MALYSLFKNDPQPFYAPLFSFNNSTFSRQYIVDSLYSKLLALGVLVIGFSEYSFRRGEIQHVSDNEMLDKDI